VRQCTYGCPYGAMHFNESRRRRGNATFASLDEPGSNPVAFSTASAALSGMWAPPELQEVEPRGGIPSIGQERPIFPVSGPLNPIRFGSSRWKKMEADE